MHVGVLGISYKSAHLALREEIAACCQDFLQQWQAVVLSTCNRTEIYFSSRDLAQTHSEILHALKKVVTTSFDHAMYSFFGRECFEHLALVTAGLDSAILGESDIQRQVKLAYKEASLRNPLSSSLHFLFQKSLKIGKEVRSTFLSPMTLEGVICSLVKSFFYEPSELKVLMIGFSEINRKVGRALLKRSQIKMTFCTRSPLSAHSFALDYGVSVIDWSSLQTWADYDLVICATYSQEPVISSLPSSFKTRLMLDLSVPRGISPDLNKGLHLALLNMEEIGKLASYERQERAQEVVAIGKMIEKSVERQIDIFYHKQIARVTPNLSLL